jgi:hypothetical protein
MKTHFRYLLGLVLALGLFAATLSPAEAFIGISVNIAPPPLPVYVQPACPDVGYVWTPGYWAWDTDANDYYWVPGAWVLAPEVGLLWTPGWWGWQDNAYCFHDGYWGRNIGFYGGINYGYGYYGHGYNGGYWRGSHFYYNRSVNNVTNIRGSYVYSRSVNRGDSRVSFNGRGGTTAVATAEERNADREHHYGATSAQNTQFRSALADPGQRYSANHGRPAVTSTTRAGSFRGTTAGVTANASRDNAATGESRTSGGGENVFTGDSHKDTQRTATANEEHSVVDHRSAPANAFNGEQHPTHVASAPVNHTSPMVERHVSTPSFHPSVSASHFSESHSYSAPSHNQSFHSGGGGSFAHASVSHSGGGGGGGHSNGGGHSGGGNGGGGNGGNNHH